MEWFSVHIGLSFSGGLIDYLFFGVLPRAPHWYMVFPVGLVMGAVYYALFTFAIRRWNLLTPGCEVEESTVAQENEQNDPGERHHSGLWRAGEYDPHRSLHVASAH